MLKKSLALLCCLTLLLSPFSGLPTPIVLNAQAAEDGGSDASFIYDMADDIDSDAFDNQNVLTGWTTLSFTAKTTVVGDSNGDKALCVTGREDAAEGVEIDLSNVDGIDDAATIAVTIDGYILGDIPEDTEMVLSTGGDTALKLATSSITDGDFTLATTGIPFASISSTTDKLTIHTNEAGKDATFVITGIELATGASTTPFYSLAADQDFMDAELDETGFHDGLSDVLAKNNDANVSIIKNGSKYELYVSGSDNNSDTIDILTTELDLDDDTDYIVTATGRAADGTTMQIATQSGTLVSTTAATDGSYTLTATASGTVLKAEDIRVQTDDASNFFISSITIATAATTGGTASPGGTGSPGGTASPGVIYNMQTDAEITADMTFGNGTTHLIRAGEPTIAVTGASGSKVIALTPRLNDWDAIDINLESFTFKADHQYKFTVNGKTDPGSAKVKLGQSGAPNSTFTSDADGADAFTLEKTFTAAELNAEKTANPKRNVRIQTENGGSAALEIHDIIVAEIAPSEEGTIVWSPDFTGKTIVGEGEYVSGNLGIQVQDKSTATMVINGKTLQITPSGQYKAINIQTGGGDVGGTGYYWNAADGFKPVVNGNYKVTFNASVASGTGQVRVKGSGGAWTDGIALTTVPTLVEYEYKQLAGGGNLMIDTGSTTSGVALILSDIVIYHMSTDEVDTSVEVYNMQEDADIKNATDGKTISWSEGLQKNGNPTLTVVDATDGKTLKVSGRASKNDAVDIKGSLFTDNNAEYTITVNGRLGSTADKVILQANGPKADGQYYAWLDNKDIGANGEFTLTKRTSIKDIMDGNSGTGFNKLTITTNANNGDFYIDNIVIKEHGAAPAKEPLVASKEFTRITFSDGVEVCEPRGSAKIDIGNDSKIARDGQYLKVHDRAANWNGVQINATDYITSGDIFEFSAWARRVEPGTSNIRLSHAKDAGTGEAGWTQFAGAGNSTVTDKEWVELKGTATFTGNVGDKIIIYIEETATADFYVDDINFVKIGNWPPSEWDMDLPSIKDKYASNFKMGNILSPGANTTFLEDSYGSAEFFKKHYSVVTAENAMKPDQLSNAKDTYDFSKADQIIDWATAAGVEVHGHTLVWHSQSPLWLNDGLTRADAKTNMENYITAVATHYKGKVISWDVVNEAFGNDAEGFDGKDWKTALRTANTGNPGSKWYAAYANGAIATKGETGADYIYDAFVKTREIDPNAVLYYNDYNEEQPNKRDAIALMVEDLNAQWAEDERNQEPGRLLIEGIGMQSHYWGNSFDITLVEDAIARFAETGAEISISELDMPMGSWDNQYKEIRLTPKDEQTQAENYAKLMLTYLAYEDYIERVTFWAMADISSWRAFGMPVLFDNSLHAKKTYDAVMNPDDYATAQVISYVSIDPDHTILTDTSTVAKFQLSVKGPNISTSTVAWTAESIAGNLVEGTDYTFTPSRKTAKLQAKSATPGTLLITASYDDGKYTATTTVDFLPGGMATNSTTLNLLETAATINKAKKEGALVPVQISKIQAAPSSFGIMSAQSAIGTKTGVKLFTKDKKGNWVALTGFDAQMYAKSDRYIEIKAVDGAKTTKNVTVEIDGVKSTNTINLTVTETYPKITLSLSAPLNMFYPKSTAKVTAIAADGSVVNVKGVAYAGAKGKGFANLSGSVLSPTKVGSEPLKVTLEMPDYLSPYKKSKTNPDGNVASFTAKVVNTVPKLKLSATTVTLGGNTDDAKIQLLSNDKNRTFESFGEINEVMLIDAAKKPTIGDKILRCSADGQVIIPKDTPKAKYKVAVTFKDPNNSRNSSAQVAVNLTVNTADVAKATISSKTKSILVNTSHKGDIATVQITPNISNLEYSDWVISKGTLPTGIAITPATNSVTFSVEQGATLTKTSKAVALEINSQNSAFKNPLKVSLSITDKVASFTVTPKNKIDIANPESRITATAKLANITSEIEKVTLYDQKIVNGKIASPTTTSTDFEVESIDGNTFTIKAKDNAVVVPGVAQKLSVKIKLENYDTELVSWDTSKAKPTDKAITINPTQTASKATQSKKAVTLYKSTPLTGEGIELNLTTPVNVTLADAKINAASVKNNDYFKLERSGENNWVIKLKDGFDPTLVNNKNKSIYKSSYTIKLELWAEGTYQVIQSDNTKIGTVTYNKGDFAPLTDTSGKAKTKPTTVSVKVNLK